MNGFELLEPVSLVGGTVVSRRPFTLPLIESGQEGVGLGMKRTGDVMQTGGGPLRSAQCSVHTIVGEVQSVIATMRNNNRFSTLATRESPLLREFKQLRSFLRPSTGEFTSLPFTTLQRASTPPLPFKTCP